MDSPAAIVVASTPALTCPACNGPVDVKSRHLAIAGSLIQVYCSARCQADAQAPRPLATDDDGGADSGSRSRWPHVVGMTVGLGLLVLGVRPPENDDAMVPPPRAPVMVAPAVVPDVGTATAGDSPEIAAQKAMDDALVAELSQDAWFHPIAGPKRRMPKNHNQAFGAERAGDRPAECASGHCGVDIAGGMWGEPIHAAHDGVVERVNRGPNEERGGIYVKIAHRDGTVFTQYFHLAAVPRWIREGTVVKAGQVIGLLGDTGVKHSAPHLHFAISVKPGRDVPERYLDPEPLISIWPLWIPDEDGTGIARVSTHEPPGLPERGHRRGGKAGKRDRKAAEPETGTEAEPEVETGTEAEPVPETGTGKATEPPVTEPATQP